MIVFLLVNAPFFSNWGMEMLIGQLYDTDDTVREEAIDILDKACEEEVGVVLWSRDSHVTGNDFDFKFYFLFSLLPPPSLFFSLSPSSHFLSH